MTDDSLERLKAIHKLSFDLVARLGAETTEVDEVAHLMEMRQEIIEKLDSTVDRLTPEHARLAADIASLDAELFAWCESEQSRVATRIAHRPRRSPRPQTEARIVSHMA